MNGQMFPEVKQTRRGVLALFVAVDYLLVTLVILLFASGALLPIVQATGGLVNRTLLGNLPLILLSVGIVMLWLGKLRPSDVGLVGSKLLVGVVVTLGLWGLAQATELALGLAADGAVAPAAEWTQVAITTAIGGLLGQLFGNALYEEIAYRGFLLPQVLVRLNARWPVRPLRALAVALIITQGLFALRHIPGDSGAGFGPADIALDLLRLTVIGIVYAALYIRTRNLFVVVGAHALVDAPAPLFASTFVDTSTLTLIFVVLALLAWPLFNGKLGKRTQLRNALGAQHS